MMASAASTAWMESTSMHRGEGTERTSWHDERNDATMRDTIKDCIHAIFTKRNANAPGFPNQRLPDFVRRLEDGLYREAKSRDEYLDQKTLEGRLQEMAKRFVQKQKDPSRAQAPQQPPAPPAPDHGASYHNHHEKTRAMKQEPEGAQAGASNALVRETSSRDFFPVTSATVEEKISANIFGGDNAGANRVPLPSETLHEASGNNGTLVMSNGAPLIRGGGSHAQGDSDIGMGYGTGPQSMPGMTMNVPPAAHDPSYGGLTNAFAAMDDGTGKTSVTKQQRWLLFLRHCAKCRQSEDDCSLKTQCKFGKQLWHHILHCAKADCEFPRCTNSKDLLKHHQKCTDSECQICVPVKDYVRRTRQQQEQQQQPPPPAPYPSSSHNLNLIGQMNSYHPNPSMMIPSMTGMIPNPSTMMPPMPGMIPNPSTMMPPMPGMIPNPSSRVSNNGGMVPQHMPQHPQHMPQNPQQMMQQMMMAGGGGHMMNNNPQGAYNHHKRPAQPTGPPMSFGGFTTSGPMGMGMPGGFMGGAIPNMVEDFRPQPKRQRIVHQQPMHGHGGGALMMNQGQMYPQGQMVPQGQMYPHTSLLTAGGMPGNDPQSSSQFNRNGMSPSTFGKDIYHRNTGTSLLETFTLEQLEMHLNLTHEAAAPARASQANRPMNPHEDTVCLVCQVTKLTFEPATVYCSTCGNKIKRSQTYYTVPPAYDQAETRGNWCHPCYSDHKNGPSVPLPDGSSLAKNQLIKKKNEDEIEEYWVACDQCEGWVHQICGLFNKGRNKNEVPYLCPICLCWGLYEGVRKKMDIRPQSMLSAQDLPHTQLSQYIEQHMANAMEQERLYRAEVSSMHWQQIPGAENLRVRVINNVMKKCEVKSRFGETFAANGAYPSEFSYRQRVLVMFQNLDGVDVCLFVMYVQEYGTDCPPPNRNCVYLSYLDSVKYFRPDNVNAACEPSNTALRTFAYHRLLEGYLKFVKGLGFEQMFIWACPPMQGDDYILYCHPNKQKIPRSDRLRNWYLDMLRDAKKTGIVAGLSTLWDTYFEGGRDHRLASSSTTQIPYLEGDYWPGEAENQLSLMPPSVFQQAAASSQPSGTDQGTAGSNGGSSTSSLTVAGGMVGSQGGALIPLGGPARPPGGSGSGSGGGPKGGSGGSKGKRAGNLGSSPDEILMNKLGEVLGGNMKEDFIVVHLAECCNFCRTYVHHGCVYKHQVPLNSPPLRCQPHKTIDGIKAEVGFNVPTGPIYSIVICHDCFEEEKKRWLAGPASLGWRRLPTSLSPEKLVPIFINKGETLVDHDKPMECEFFETRQSFLNLCVGNHYQFDTIRRAKHSSMMVLYHLHNPEAPGFLATCALCHTEIEAGSGFKCTLCSDFEVCVKCMGANNANGHPHPLKASNIDETRYRLTDQERKSRDESIQRTIQLVEHAASCMGLPCTSNSCLKVRQMFQHVSTCQVRSSGGCSTCKKMWMLCMVHAKSCTKHGDCQVPKCREIKELRRKQASRQEDQRRQAYQKMLRNQAQTTGNPT